MQQLTEKQIEKIKFKSDITDKKLNQLAKELSPFERGREAKIYKFIGLDKNPYVLRVRSIYNEDNDGEEINAETIEESNKIHMLAYKLNLAPKLYKVKIINNKEYKVMDYIDGEPLNEYLIKNKNSYDILDKVLDCLKILHNNHISHQDFHLRNIMIDKDKNVYFIDFDYAIITDNIDDFDRDYYLFFDYMAEDDIVNGERRKETLYVYNKIKLLCSDGYGNGSYRNLIKTY